MLSRQHCTEKILLNVVLILLGQHSQVKTLYNVAQEAPDKIAQEKVMCSVVLILLGQYSTGKTLCNIVLEAADNIAQEKYFSMLL